MNTTSSIAIRIRATQLWEDAWAARDRLWHRSAIAVDDFVLQVPEKIATGILGFRVDHVAEIPTHVELLGSADGVTETVGQMDRLAKQIVVAQKVGFQTERFTLAHEIGHAVLHEGLLLHRERSLNGESAGPRTPEELQADVFAAELLMPAHLVRDQFLARFAGPVNGRDRDEALVFWLGQDGAKIDSDRFFRNDRRYRATMFATSRCFHTIFAKSMCQYFGVSPRAMAIQLEDLGWVY